MPVRPALLLALLASPALAQQVPADPPVVTPPDEAAQAAPQDVLALFDAMELPGIIAVMAREGEAYGAELGGQLYQGEALPDEWTATVAGIYDAGRMETEVLEDFAAALRGEDVAPMLAFFAAEPGATFARLELSAREAMLDDDVEQMAKEAAAVAIGEGSPRLDLIRRYAEANDLVETNVVAALNGNMAYYLGPAGDEDLEALIAFSETEAGQALNQAVFAAFDETFTGISRALGRASARAITTEQL